MANEAAPLMDELKESVADLGRTAADKLNENRKAAAGGLKNAAAAIDERADGLPGGEGVADLAHATASKLNNTARYVRKRDVNGMLADLGNGVKNHPVPALAIAAGLGFLVCRAFTSND
jgi:ElaB/YqjD/DUF883 family membrane-anchored ribosome-binding protein